MPDNGWSWSFEKRIASDTSDGREVVAVILEEMQKADWAEHDVFGVHLGDRRSIGQCHQTWKPQGSGEEGRCGMLHHADRVQIRITDEGEGFDPEAVPDPRMKRIWRFRRDGG